MYQRLEQVERKSRIRRAELRVWSWPKSLDVGLPCSQNLQ
jgi:hypothetical protein